MSHSVPTPQALQILDEYRPENHVTGDDDLLTLNAYQDIPILNAADALRKIEAGM